MKRPGRMLVVAIAGLMGPLCSPAPSLAAGLEQQSAVHNQDLPPEIPVLVVKPGLMSPRRGPIQLAVTAAALPIDDAIRQCVESDMQAIGAPGAAVTVILEGQVIFNRGFGVKRRGGGDPVNADTRFRIGSITKMLTAAAVMHQLDLGLLQLDDPVSLWIPELSFTGRWSPDEITVRHLLTHSSAIPDHVENPYYPTGDHALAQWASSLDDVVILAPPGTFWNYSNPGYCLAGLVAERAGGMFYRELMQRTVFDLADMHATTFSPAQAMASGNYSYGHDEQAVYAPDAYESWLASPSGLAFSTAPDLAKWALLLMEGGGIVLSSSSAEAMQRRQIYLDHIPRLHYGFGIFAEEYKGLDVRQHGGNIPGWGSWLLWVPEERFVVSVLANTTMSLSEAAYCIVDAVLETGPAEHVDYSTDPATWKRYAGTYRLMSDEGDAFDAEVRKTIDRFFMTIIDSERQSAVFSSELVQKYLDTFFVDQGFGPLEPDLTVQPTVTFINRNTAGSGTMWLRNRGIVGERTTSPRRAAGRAAPE